MKKDLRDNSNGIPESTVTDTFLEKDIKMTTPKMFEVNFFYFNCHWYGRKNKYFM